MTSGFLPTQTIQAALVARWSHTGGKQRTAKAVHVEVSNLHSTASCEPHLLNQVCQVLIAVKLWQIWALLSMADLGAAQH